MMVRVFFSGDDPDREEFRSIFESSFRELGLRIEFSEPPDRLQGRNDASEMLSRLLRKTGAHPSIWVAEGELHLPGAGSIFGCAAGRCAIITTSGLTRSAWINVAMHEMGHILGLEHCTGHCLMQPALNPEDVMRRPFALCERCFRTAEQNLRRGLSLE